MRNQEIMCNHWLQLADINWTWWFDDLLRLHYCPFFDPIQLMVLNPINWWSTEWTSEGVAQLGHPNTLSCHQWKRQMPVGVRPFRCWGHTTLGKVRNGIDGGSALRAQVAQPPEFTGVCSCYPHFFENSHVHWLNVWCIPIFPSENSNVHFVHWFNLVHPYFFLVCSLVWHVKLHSNSMLS